MLENLAAWVLKHYLDKYVENLNTDKLSIGVLQGAVELENLPLKKDALRQAGFPVQITSGFIGKVKLQVPIRQFRSAPWVILIEKLYLVASPVKLSDWDEEKEEQALHDIKLSSLASLEAQWRAEIEGREHGYYASSYSSWMSYGTSIITNVIENLQLNISDVHIRYEDDGVVSNEIFTCGLTIDSLIAQSTNEKWEPGFSSGDFGYKLVELTKLSIYWDSCKREELIGDVDPQLLIEMLGKQTYRGKQFLLSPVSAIAHLKRNKMCEPIRSRSNPRIVCDLILEQVPLMLSDIQYNQMVVWVKGLQLVNIRARNNKYRPTCPVIGNHTLWWKYFVNAALQRPLMKWTLDVALQRARENITYVDLYTKLLSNPASALTDEQKCLKDKVELERSFDEIKCLREVSKNRLYPITVTAHTAQPAGRRFLFSTWFPQWWYSTPDRETGRTSEDERELQEELLDTLSDPIDDNTFLRRDVIFGQFNFSLKQGSINLCSVKDDSKIRCLQSMLELQFEKVIVGYESRPRSGSHKASVALGAMYLKDRLTADTVFPILIAPQGRDVAPLSTEHRRNLPASVAKFLPSSTKPNEEPLFQLTYEKKPITSCVDYRLHMKTQCLDIVYNPAAVSWLTDFFVKPHQEVRAAAKQKYQAIKKATKNELIKNWEKILTGNLHNRKTWDIDLDISAPQIILVEHFCNKNAVMVVVDLGRLHTTNGADNLTTQDSNTKSESDDEEAFQTPCSTPPGSEASLSEAEPPVDNISTLNELTLHHKLYDKYKVELSDIQVLVGKVRDNWAAAHGKASSSLHMLNKFNICLQIERRVVHTNDPQFPSLTLCGDLPKLVVHANDQKIGNIRTLIAAISAAGVSSPFRSSDTSPVSENIDAVTDSEDDNSYNPDSDASNEHAKLVLMQFIVQQLALELQSRNRSIAELQVSGVRASCTLRRFDTSLSLSVHSLLLVDALQTFGPDFELLMASHKHVGMDTVSGSLRDSEPTSPISPASPELGNSLASPVAISQALSSLQHRAVSPTEPPTQHQSTLVDNDAEALISVEVVIVHPKLDGQAVLFSSIQFNSLDIIANQETIVELLGFFKRIFPPSTGISQRINVADLEKNIPSAENVSTSNELNKSSPSSSVNNLTSKTELTFDFHRLNILLLRAVVRDGVVVGRKICTATMTQAKIKATVGEEVVVEGSLGGIQVLDLTPEGQKHQRILSLGSDPLTVETNLESLSAGLYSYATHPESDKKAFSFVIRRNLCLSSTDYVKLEIRMASVWYTHSPLLVLELQSCATEFKQYLSNLARSIKSAAAEMAIGLVHARAEALAQSLSMTGRLPMSLYGGSTPDIGSPLKRKRSLTQSIDTITPFTPYSPGNDDVLDTIDIRLDIVLDTPVIVLPQSSSSPHVFVAHLGKITVNNSNISQGDDNVWDSPSEKFEIEIRDMNLYSLETTNVNMSINTGDVLLPRPERMYACTGGEPILHNTLIQLFIARKVEHNHHSSWDALDMDNENESSSQLKIAGGVVDSLKVSLSRHQYQQVLTTINSLLVNTTVTSDYATQTARKLDDIEEEGAELLTGISTLSLDPSVRARMLSTAPTAIKHKMTTLNLVLQATFEIPNFTVELIGSIGNTEEQALVSISFQDFLLMYNQSQRDATCTQMSLKSLVMEDLLADKNSKHRCLVVSSATPEPPPHRSQNISMSCPDLTLHPKMTSVNCSLPDRLYRPQGFKTNKLNTDCPCTPPPSPRPPQRSPTFFMSRNENLVLINITQVNRNVAGLTSLHDNVDKTVTVDFNCLDVIVNVDSWVVVLDFFDIDQKDTKDNINTNVHKVAAQSDVVKYHSKTELEVRSLNVILLRSSSEVAKANMSQLSVRSERCGLQVEVEGKLGSLSLHDLTIHGLLYKERFLTCGNQALYFKYRSNGSDGSRSTALPYDSELILDMSSVVYVHTQRFLCELQTFFTRFSTVKNLLASKKHKNTRTPSTRLSIEINAGSPVLLLPISSMSSELIVADLGKLTIRNSFSLSSPNGTTTVPCLMDVMTIDLVNMDLFAAKRVVPYKDEKQLLEFGSLTITKEGPSLLPDKYHLKLQVHRNLDTHLTREVPDMSVQGTLAKIEASIDLFQYKIIRGLLSYNLGEVLPEFEYIVSSDGVVETSSCSDPVWLYNSIHLELVNVLVHLKHKHADDSSFACVNFIRSRLIIEMFSDRSQDVDLVSAEILINDTRYNGEPMNKRLNVFTNILQPLGNSLNLRYSKQSDKRDSSDGAVQAEIHHRRRKDYSKATVLLNNMTLMAILDWWELVRDFVVENAVVTAPPVQEQELNYSTAASGVYKPNTQISASLGVVTKCPPVIDAVTPFEFKLNITDSEIVLVENTSVWDTNAIILKSTTVITYRPGMLEKPLSCNLNHCEVFSCVLGMVEETSLSIIDPVTVNMELVTRACNNQSRGLVDAMVNETDKKTLEIQLQQLSVRLSYHDFKMLSQMLEKLPEQTLAARNRATEQENRPVNVRNQIAKLSALGFAVQDCAEALECCSGQLDDAALWLTHNATHLPSVKTVLSDTGTAVSFQTIEIKLGRLRICVIDDCKDADVPLLELSLSQLFLKKTISGEGSAKFVFSSDYYNRVLSGWEPFIEPWRCCLSWEHCLTSGLSPNRLEMTVNSTHRLELNLTRTLIDLYSLVKDNWTQDYYNPNKTTSMEQLTTSVHRRSPFVPYVLKNNTGSRLWFTTLISTPENLWEQSVYEESESWAQVEAGDTVPFTFEESGKVRHRDTHKVRVHQIVVRVDMWRPVSPVSIDKVGVYFRQASPQPSFIDLPSARIVFSVALEGSAMKVITVRSALIINNRLTEDVEVKLENMAIFGKAWEPTKCFEIKRDSSMAVPLSHALSRVSVRPLNSHNLNRYHAFSSRCIEWSNVNTPGSAVEDIHQCHSNLERSYRFVASIKRENYPQHTTGRYPQPAHTITLYSPVTIVNLLPCDFNFIIREASYRGHVKAGLTSSVHEVDISKRFEITFVVEGFPKSGSLTVDCPTSSFRTRVKLYDDVSRPLEITAVVQTHAESGLKVTVLAPYWIINKTALPLVFKQEGTVAETAGQFEEHEVARVVAPLLFSLSDQDASPAIQARIGEGYHADCIPQWCQSFHLQMGAQVRRLRVASRDSRPDLVYLVGIYIRSGKGRYRHTNVVTLSSRFQIHNKSSHKLQFAQKCLASTLNDPGAAATYASAVGDCSLAWHWPRLDKDLLLCVRMTDVADCQWSGGFTIDMDDSLHVNIRNKQGKMHFLRVEVILQRATYFVVFSDADTMPPPIRVDNFSPVAIKFYQSGTNGEYLQTSVRPQTSVPYAWDYPLSSTCLTIVAPGEAAASYDIKSDSDESRPISLTYENFIYIAFTATFNNVIGEPNPCDVQSQQLVLDCVDGYHVILNRKQQGARSQLWRMTSEGQLQHEGSSPPRDPRSKTTNQYENMLVLDIGGTAPQPTMCAALVLRKADRRRSSTQTWRFTDEGRLCCAHRSMCVQAKDGFFGLRQGNEAVLGPISESSSNVTMEQAVGRMKLRPGSGCLSVSVSSNGPTRVLRITDPFDARGSAQFALVHDKEWGLITSDEAVNTESNEFHLTLELADGLGISIVSRKPAQELLYVYLKGIVLDTVKTNVQRTLDCTIQDIQVDNQLFECDCPVVVYIIRGTKEEDARRHLPAVQFSAHKQLSNNVKAHLFKHFILSVKNLSLTIEEQLLLKLYLMFVYNGVKNVEEDADESDHETQRLVMEATSVHTIRYYFGVLKLAPSLVRLSLITSSKLSPELHAVKKELGLTLIKFEDASVELKPYIKRHPFETAQSLINSVLKHFKQELKWRAAFILASVDFLGNPGGFINDVSEGVSGFFLEGNVGALLKGVTHGLSNSAAKVTESLSDGLGRVTLDDEHEETRIRIRKLHSGSSGAHFFAGLHGLGFGVLGGVTSVFKQTYEGASSEGMQGLVSGFGRGLVGTVTKPVVGVLDCATEMANMVRVSSRSSVKQSPHRTRLPRCCLEPSGLLQLYSYNLSKGQEYLYHFNERDYTEALLGYESLRSEGDDLKILISNESIRVFSAAAMSVVVQCQLSHLYDSQPTAESNIYYVKLTIRDDGMRAPYGQEIIKRPLVACDSKEVAVRVSEQINYAKALHEERMKTLVKSDVNVI